MTIHNSEIADIFDTMADLLEIKGENPFRIRAYHNAARTIRGISIEMSEMLDRGLVISSYPGIGKDLANKIREIVETGHLAALDSLGKQTSVELVKLMRIAGLGGRRVAMIHKNLGITSIAQLENAAREHKICKLPGFGEKIETSIIEGIKKSRVSGGKYPLPAAEEIAGDIMKFLRINSLGQVTLSGSFRRHKEVIGDIDILVTAEESPSVFDSFLLYPDISKVVVRGETKLTVILKGGIQVDIRVVAPESYGAALHYFTGSQAHNIAIRKRGVKRGLKINEYGIFREGTRLCGEEENDVFRAVDLPFIPAELREDQGEIEAAENGTLPELIMLSDIKGDLHMHTIATDGHNTIEEMAAAAKALGYSYIAITDHSKRLAMAHGLSERELADQIDKIDKLNQAGSGVRILKGSEVDILEDGSLDLDNSVLKQLDLTVCSIHSKFNLNVQQQTDRILRAMDNPCFTILAHPTGRLINRREAYDIDIERILIAAKERNIILEVNSYPDRLDLNAEHCRMAMKLGVRLSINTDSHSRGDLNFMRFGIYQARRGWVERKMVINACSLPELLNVLHRS